MRKIAAFLISLFALTSCEFVSSLIHDDQLIARLGDEKLYVNDLSGYIPDYISSEDSVRLTRQFIDTWASEILYMKMAQSQLSKEEMDVSSELEDYRRSLLKYRYEQRYVNDRLDTLVTDAQISDYYEQHSAVFALERPVLRYRFLDVAKICPDKETLVKLMSSDDADDCAALDSLASATALRFVDRSQNWSDILVLAKDFDAPWQDLLKDMGKSYIKLLDPITEEEKIAYVCEIKTSGAAPLEYCKDEIISIIQSKRKHELLNTLEQDLLTDALEHKKLIIY